MEPHPRRTRPHPLHLWLSLGLTSQDLTASVSLHPYAGVPGCPFHRPAHFAALVRPDADVLHGMCPVGTAQLSRPAGAVMIRAVVAKRAASLTLAAAITGAAIIPASARAVVYATEPTQI